MNTLPAIRDAINNGKRAIDIARDLGVSRERIRQLVHKISIDQLHPPCHYCGLPMEADWGLKHPFHQPCMPLNKESHRREVYLEKRRPLFFHQRTAPDGWFECVAVNEYAQRGYKVLWMPQQCQFDYVVNGHKVDVKGAQLHNGKWQWRLAKSLKRRYENEGKVYPYPIEMSKRCDIVHLIGENGDNRRHFIVPSEVLDGITGVTVVPNGLPRRNRCLDFDDSWNCFERQLEHHLTIRVPILYNNTQYGNPL